ncbi:MAG: endonuclease/exonuclease/phosphatase family protein, partial [Muribaculaceae bacterium]|nr:endonuclease/exonuclease/phosphatase family protein [Muribaculaceae bacterium]
VDEVKIYDRVLSPDEVASEYETYFPSQTTAASTPADRLRVMVWNIWHGGARFGEHVGLARTAQVIKESNPDLVGIVEAYGGASVLADSLGYYYYLLSDNLAILSRFPFKETIKVFNPQKSGGIIADLPDGKKVAFFDIWLNWRWDTDTIRSNDIRSIAPTLERYGKNADEIPVISVGDYNSGTHLDKFGYRVYGEKRIDNPEISWPSKVMVDELGYIDSFRQLYPDSELYPGSTWTPLYNGMRKPVPNRVDFIYYKGKGLKPYFTETFSHHGAGWPSDHAAVITDFFLK